MDRNRGGSYLTTLLVGLGMFGMFLFLTYYLQETLHYSALKTGFAYLPFSVGVVAGAAVSSQLILRFRPRLVMSVGLLMAITGMLWFSQIGVHTGYWDHLFPAELVMAFGMGMVFVPVNNTALIGVAPADAGVASALINSTQQVGGSVGTALLNTIATTVTASYLHTHAGGAAGARRPSRRPRCTASRWRSRWRPPSWAWPWSWWRRSSTRRPVQVAPRTRASSSTPARPASWPRMGLGLSRQAAADRGAAPVRPRAAMHLGPFPPAARGAAGRARLPGGDGHAGARCHTGEVLAVDSTTRSSAAPIPPG